MPASTSAVQPVEEAAYSPAKSPNNVPDSGSATTAQAAEVAEAAEQSAAAATPPESPVSPPREISPVSAKILAAEAGTMHNAKSTYKTPAPGLGGGFGAFDYEPPAPPAERPVGSILVVPVVAALQDSPRPGSVRELSATFSGPLSLSRSASGASDEFPRFRGGVGRAHSTDGSDTFSDAADPAAASRVNRRSSLGAPPLAAEYQVSQAAHEDDDDEDFGTFEEVGDAPEAAPAAGPAVKAAADRSPGAEADGFGTFEEAAPSAVPVVAAAESGGDAAAAGDDESFAAFSDDAGGDDDGFGDFDAAPTVAPVSAPAVCCISHHLSSVPTPLH